MLVNNLLKDIQFFLDNHEQIFFNESDLQHQLALYLASTKNYDQIHLEYYVNMDKASPELYPKSDIYIDIVVEKDGEFVPVELKYKTLTISNYSYSTFGEPLSQQPVLRDHGAENIGCYSFWRDVKRIDDLKGKFEHVNSGIAIFITNDDFYYKNKFSEKAAYYPFRLSSDNSSPVDPKYMDWKHEVAIRKDYPPFKLSKSYTPCKWADMKILNNKLNGISNFKYTYVIL